MSTTLSLDKVSIRITPSDGGISRTLTALKDYDLGDSKDTTKLSDPDIYGNVSISQTVDNSRDSIKITVRSRTSDDAFLTNIANNKIKFNMVIIDERSDEFKEEVTTTETFAVKGGAGIDADTLDFTMKTPLFESKRV